MWANSEHVIEHRTRERILNTKQIPNLIRNQNLSNMCSPLFAEFDNLKNYSHFPSFRLREISVVRRNLFVKSKLFTLFVFHDVQPILAVSTVRYFEKRVFGRGENAIMN